MTVTQKALNELINEDIADNIAVCFGIKDNVLGEYYYSRKGKINENTRFDMASVSKILATTTITLIALDKGLLRLEDKVSGFFECSAEKADLTVINLLTHTMGIGHKSLNKEGNSYSNIAEYILNIPSDIPVGTNVLYSCPAFILLGKILEKIFGKRLDALFEELVATPLGMYDTSFLPCGGEFVNSNINEADIGLVNDYNCRFLGGVAGNAGVFSNIKDMKKFVKMLYSGGAPIISQKAFQTAIKNYTPEMSESRGVGFVYVDEKYSQTGRLFPDGSIGHCGHTGQSVFVDTQTGFFAIILSDMTIKSVKRFGQEDYDLVIATRERIHNAIKEDLL